MARCAPRRADGRPRRCNAAALAGVERPCNSGRSRPIFGWENMASDAPAEHPMTGDVALEGVPGRYWHALDDGRIQCDVCPRFCKLHEGQRGLCFVRARQDDGIVLTTYGRSSGFCIDPIEKKPLNHFLPGTPVLSFGTAGCNLTCKFCQNWDISKAREIDRLQDQASPEAIAEAGGAQRLRASVAYTYNDPVIFLEYAIDVARGLPRARASRTSPSPPATSAPAPRARALRAHGRGQRRPQGVHRGFYRKLCTGAARRGARDARVSQARDRGLARDHDAADPGRERRRRRDRGAERAGSLDELGPDVPLHFTAFHPDFKMLDTPPHAARRR